jgi:hypothetical protein
MAAGQAVVIRTQLIYCSASYLGELSSVIISISHPFIEAAMSETRNYTAIELCALQAPWRSLEEVRASAGFC